jgi:hypothetical protein
MKCLLTSRAARLGSMILVLTQSAVELSAQSTSAPTSATPSPRQLDLFGGGTLLRMEPGADLDRTGLAGWQASVTFFPAMGDGFASRFGVAGEFVQARRTPSLDDAQVPGTFVRLTERTFLAGPAIRLIRRQRLTSNLRVLFGVASLSTKFPDDRDQDGIAPGQEPASIGVFGDETVAAVGIGTAWEIRMAPGLALRVNPSALITRFAGQTQVGPRLTTGIVIRWQTAKGR